ncbi:MAG TPA: glycoside hydrolase family 57 protein [Polyangiaceae bacterium]|nr:glycoside hydrolase family 57 protein [Polyangiaceae bacterium]
MSKLGLALLWHQHQPLYRDLGAPSAAGAYRLPWVRLHALRDYYSMATMAAAQPGLELVVNLTPVLLWQIADYTERGATDRSLELTLKPAETLTANEQQELLATFFRADREHQIRRHARYEALLARRDARQAFAPSDFRDLQAWTNLAWFGPEFRNDAVRLVTGETASVRRFVEKAAGFSRADIDEIVAEQLKIMRAIVPLHRELALAGHIELSTTPFYHPILPILIDSDAATLDGESARPRRFTHPEDAHAQVENSMRYYEALFGRRPRGMWPAEAAVSQAAVSIFAEHGLDWIATDGGVLAKSGRFGYRADDANVLCRPYRTGTSPRELAIFFRERELSSRIGFSYHRYEDPKRAADDFVAYVHDAILSKLPSGEDHVLSVILDGENSWGAYADEGRGFLQALYARLVSDPDVTPTTFSRYLDGGGSTSRPPHPVVHQERVYELFTGSWIDSAGSAPGVDLGTWLGHAEENRAWDLLGEARDAVVAAGHSPASNPAAFEALYAAEGSDWFWWFGEDQGSDWDAEIDELFRLHLRQAYRAAGLAAPASLAVPIADRLR